MTLALDSSTPYPSDSKTIMLLPYSPKGGRGTDGPDRLTTARGVITGAVRLVPRIPVT